MEEYKMIWDTVISILEKDHGAEAMELWFKPTKVVGLDNDTITISVSNEIAKNAIQNHYMSELEQAFKRALGFPVKVELVIPSVGQTEGQAENKTAPWETGYVDTNHYQDENTGYAIPQNGEGMLVTPDPASFRFKYTFENFIEGNSNKFARAACLAVADHPADQYNPLFIYGNSGLGKTHLLYATINRLKNNIPGISIIYIKGDDFINQMITCLANHNMTEFREKFRKCDVLLIDDIQFIAGKQSIQEEFFHTFNALFEAGKQIILTSDRPPRDIQLLEERLRTRFEWGLLADIEPPDFELRTAILQNKAKQLGCGLTQDVLHYLADNLRNNIRQMEGVLKKMYAQEFISGAPTDLETTKEIVADFLGGEKPMSVTVDKIFDAVGNKYGVSREDLESAKRNKEIASARHVLIYLIRNMTDMSLPNIAKMLGRDHSTIIASCTLVEKKLSAGGVFAAEIADLKEYVLG